MSKQYEVMYYNDVFKDWMRIGHWIFDRKGDAQKYININKLSYPDLEFKITEYEKPRPARTKSVGRKVTCEKA